MSEKEKQGIDFEALREEGVFTNSSRIAELEKRINDPVYFLMMLSRSLWDLFLQKDEGGKK